ncbi:MAG: hypothetical protein ABUS56_02805 [Acidobacteriota bacterium]
MIPGKQYSPEVVLQIAWRRKWVIVIPAIAIAGASVAWTHRLIDVYRSETLIQVVPPRISENYVRSTVTISLQDRLQSISQQILSRTRLEKTIEDFNLYPVLRKTAIMEDVVEQMRGNIDLQPVRGDVFRVSFTSEDPRAAMRVSERLASLFIDESLKDREVLAEGTNQFLESQLEDARRRLVDTETKLREYRALHNGQLPNQLESNLQGMHNTQLQLQALLDSLNRDRDRHLVVERSIADMSMSDSLANSAGVPLAHDAPEPSPETAAGQLRAAQGTLRALQLRLKPEHPDIVNLRRTIAELQRKADAEAAEQPVSSAPVVSAAETMRRTRLQDLQTELTNLNKQIADKTNEEKRLRDVVAEYQKRIEAEPTRETELTELTRDYGTQQGMYTSLLGKKLDSQLSTNLERRQVGEQFKILDPARLPTRPFSPNRPRYYGMGILAGIATGLALAGLLEYFDRTMRTEEDVRAALNLPVLATIPIIRESPRTRRRRAAAAAATAAALLLACAAGLAGVLR